ncbi:MULTISPECIES: hypothetical protein [unclassified Flavobacterium]|uniref:hypothetical protein n=1 Tax=unclassified Flavobacterium TaxID=196869 RepID=UPI0005806B90|nr:MULTISPECIES: hypothetical protein [unclassified Flavobacterium]KIA95622.1 hypothetical protein OA93_17890 [Flavobacterium sp. KMS]OUL63448.1 hypothetical protein B8T70_04930 [Flavobacterium sp. AJR]
MKKQEIKILLNQIALKKGIGFTLTDSVIESLAERISNLQETDRFGVKSIIDSVSIYVKESVDFTDTNYLIDQIVDIVNKK